ncbi:hypothetical protein [Saccharothrix yanglingensis]|nr:hypothetical protein [Saccharothrix yanglingensis]
MITPFTAHRPEATAPVRTCPSPLGVTVFTHDALSVRDVAAFSAGPT